MTNSTGSGQEDSGDSDDTLEVSFVDELGVQNLEDPVVGGRGRLFSVAGRNTPVAEFTEEFLVLHPPQKPFADADIGPSEEIALLMDDSGVLLNELGERRKIKGAKFNGKELFYFWEQRPGTLKHYAVWFDESENARFLLINGERVTTDKIYALRNKTHDGELTRFAELRSD